MILISAPPPSLINEIRDEFILKNFITTDSKIYTLGELQCLKREPLSSMLILKYSIQQLCKTDILHIAKNVIQIITMIAFTVFAIAPPCIFLPLIKPSMNKAHEKLTSGNCYWYRYNNLLQKVPIRKYDVSDYRKEVGFGIFMSLLGSTLLPSLLMIPVLFAWDSHHQNPNSLVNIFRNLKEINKSQQQYVLPFNEAQPLAMQELGFQQNIPYAQQVLSTLPQIFGKDLEDQKIYHPLKEQYMTDDEQQHFIRDLCNLFSIPKQNFLDCWNIENLSPSEIPESLSSEISQIETLQRINKFLNLLPLNTTTLLSQEHPICKEYLSW